jgi:hypothetical protein
LVAFAEALIQARWLVGSLGEHTSPPWWRSQATSSAGRRFLALLFPRTADIASLETAGQAALLEHDARIGRHGVFHLFRLPMADEATINDLLRQIETSAMLAPLAALTDHAPRLAALRKLSGGVQPVEGSGPIHCGPVRAIHDGGMLRRICATYLAAFEDGRPRYPYLEDRS